MSIAAVLAGERQWFVAQGHVLDALRAMPSESVQVCVTSPPYWGLRAYKTEPQVWGGRQTCNFYSDAAHHEWVEQATERTQPDTSVHSTLNDSPPLRNEIERGNGTVTTAFCARCGAWRGELGSEPTIELYVEHIVAVFREVRRVLRSDGTIWCNVGDSYAGSGKGPTGHNGVQQAEQRQGFVSAPFRNGKAYQDHALGPSLGHVDGLKAKDLCLIPFRLALALQADGWWVRSDIAWCKAAPMPESVRDRPTSAWEHIFLLSRSAKYFYDQDAVREPVTREWDPATNNPGQLNGEGKYHALGWGQSPPHGFDSGPNPLGRNLWNYWLLGPEPFSDWGEAVRRVPVAWDEAGDDTTRIPSPNCPVHGDPSDPATSAPDGGRGADASSHNGHSDDRPALGQLFDSAPIEKPREPGSERDTLDSPGRPGAPPAIAHSTGTSRTGRVPATSPAYSASAQSPDHTDGTSESPASDGQSVRTPESRSGADASLGEPRSDPSERTPSHTADTDTCTCTYYREVTERISHFATFPTEIPRRAILAGTSERGCCPQCGAPWRRVVERSSMVVRASEYREDVGGAEFYAGRTAASGTMLEPPTSTTLGWQPSCSCTEPFWDGVNGGVCPPAPVPCVVLDPFSGSGTTGMVALRHGRRYVGIELNAEYVAMSEKRIREDAPLFNANEVWPYLGVPEQRADDQMELL